MVLCIHTYDYPKSSIYMTDYLSYSYIECQHFHDSPHRNQFSCLINEILVNQDVSFPEFLIMGICQHVNCYRVLGNLLLIALTSIVLGYSTPILPFFILKAEPFIFVKLVSMWSSPGHPLFMVLGPLSRFSKSLNLEPQ